MGNRLINKIGVNDICDTGNGYFFVINSNPNNLSYIQYIMQIERVILYLIPTLYIINAGGSMLL